MSVWLYVLIYLFCRENATGSGLGRFLLKLAQSCSLCETFRETPPGAAGSRSSRCSRLPHSARSAEALAIEAPVTEYHRWGRYKQRKFISQLWTLSVQDQGAIMAVFQ